MKKKLLIVDDSVVIRTFLNDLFENSDAFDVIGTASDPYKARAIMKQNWPDIITLDIEMPRMNGIEFLKKIMKSRPTPVVMISTLTKKGAGVTLEALDIGAIDYFPKPDSSSWTDLNKAKDVILEKVINASKANMAKKRLLSPHLKKLQFSGSESNLSKKTILIGSSTGGVQALTEIFSRLPKNIPGIVVVQHMPKYFLESLAVQLDKKVEPEVKMAVDGQPITAGTIYIAPGEIHTGIERRSGLFYLKHFMGDAVGYHKPAVNVLFRSAAQIGDPHILGVILTGMGDDGAKGMAQMRKRGCRTIGQDKASAIVYGMPKKAYEMGGVEYQYSLEEIPRKLMDFGEGKFE